MTNILRQYGIKEVADVTFYELDNDQPGNPVLMLDTLKISSIELTSESTDAKGGKGNAPLITWDYGKEIVLKIEDALFSARSLSLATGKFSKPELGEETMRRVNVYGIHKDTKIWKKENNNWVSQIKTATLANKVSSSGLTVDGKFLLGKVTMRTPKGVEVDLWKDLNDKDLQTKLLNDCFYENENKGEIYLKSGYYLFAVITNLAPQDGVIIGADSYPGTYYIVGDTVIRDANTGADRLYRFVIPKAKVLLENNTIAMEAEGDPAVLSMSLKVLKPKTGPMMYCQDYLDFYGVSVQMRTFLAAINTDSEPSEEEMEEAKKQALEIEGQNGNLAEVNGKTYITRSIPMASRFPKARVLRLDNNTSVEVVSSNQTIVEIWEPPTDDPKYPGPEKSTSKGFSYGAKTAYHETDIKQTKQETNKGTAVVELMRVDGVILSLINVDSATIGIHYPSRTLAYCKVVLDESNGHVWIAVNIDTEGNATFDYWIDPDWIYSKEGYAWIVKMAGRVIMDGITLFNPFGKAASLGTRIIMSLGNRFALRAAVFQLDETLKALQQNYKLTIEVMDYIKQEMKEIINEGGN